MAIQRYCDCCGDVTKGYVDLMISRIRYPAMDTDLMLCDECDKRIMEFISTIKRKEECELPSVPSVPTVEKKSQHSSKLKRILDIFFAD